MAEPQETQKIILARHGHRYPFVREGHDLYPYEGRLTGYGIGELVKIAHGLKEKFSVFLPEAYDPEKIAFHSTPTTRTIQSAQLTAFAMYPGENIPINNLVLENDSWHKNVSQGADASAQFYKFLEDNQLRWIPENEAMRRQVCQLLNVADLIQRWWVATELFHYFRHMKKLPPGFSDGLADQLWCFLSTEYKLCNAFKDNLARNARHHIEFLTKLMANRAGGKDSVKFHYISSHDSNLSAVLTALGVEFLMHPNYAEHIEITLYENRRVTIKPHDSNSKTEISLDNFRYNDDNKIDEELLSSSDSLYSRSDR